MFIAALFTVAKTWKQLKCLLTEDWIKRMWYIHTKKYYSDIKKNEIMPFAATWMDLETVILSEVSQTEGEKYPITSLICIPGSSDGKASAYNEGDPGSIPVSGSSPGEGNGNPLQYSCRENPMD